eukprot:TRINITY_DN3699_c0_g1_i2.p1 TRINITY_DN3699_c0_g1~~TRINITY_DN3699_c0_g1_i2.p1  ORF type:complete len:1080 (+),score=205.06 TRINITY_DN3699_c0_g1_i2:159-3242(+)
MALLSYFENTRQQFIRLLVLMRWSASAPDIDRAKQILTFLDQHNKCFAQAAYALHMLYIESAPKTRAPVYDTQTAVDVLSTGTYLRFPRSIKDAPRHVLNLPPQKLPLCTSPTMDRLDAALRFRLFSTLIPQQFSSLSISKGRLVCVVENEFRIFLTLEGSALHWRLLGVEITVPGSPLSVGSPQTLKLSEFAQTRMKPGAETLVDLYKFLHEFCVSLQLELASVQADTIKRTCRTHSIKLDCVKDNHVAIYYWRMLDRSGENSPYVKLYVDQWGHLQLDHHPPIEVPDSCPVTNLRKQLRTAIIYHSSRKLRVLQDRLLALISTKALGLQPKLRTTAEDCTLLVPLFNQQVLVVGIDEGSGKYVLEYPANSKLDGQAESKLNESVAVIDVIVTELLSNTALEFVERMGKSQMLVINQSRQGEAIHFRLPLPWHPSGLTVEVQKEFSLKFSLTITSKTKQVVQLSQVISLSLAAGFAFEAQKVFREIVTDCKKQVAQAILKQQLVDANIPHEVRTNGLEFTYDAHGTHYAGTVRAVEDYASWEVLARDDHFRDVLGAEELATLVGVTERGPAERGSPTVLPVPTVVTVNLGEWSFQYDKLYDSCFKLFLDDFAKVCVLCDIKQQILSSGPEYTSVQEAYRASTRHVFYVDLPSLEIPQQHIVVSITGGLSNVVPCMYFTPPTALSTLYMSYVTCSRTVVPLLKLAITSVVPLCNIRQFTNSPSRLPYDYEPIAHSVNCVRLVFRNKFALDLRFLPNKRVVIEDGAKARPQTTADLAPSHLHPITSFADIVKRVLPPYLERAAQERGAPIEETRYRLQSCDHMRMSSPPPGAGQQPAQPQPAAGQQSAQQHCAVVVHASYVYAALEALHPVLAHLHLHVLARQLLKKEFPDMQQSDAAAMVTAQGHCCIFSSQYPAKLQAQPLAVVPPGAAPGAWNSVIQYFANRVVAPPYLSRAMTAFIQLLKTPPRTFADLTELMRADLESSKVKVEFYPVDPRDPTAIHFTVNHCFEQHRVRVPNNHIFVVAGGV